MPATEGAYANNEIIIYRALAIAGLNKAAICGVLANLYKEAGFNPKNVQDSYEGILGNDDVYTKKVDTKSIKESGFATDEAGYGICQWTFSSRKSSMYNFIVKQRAKSIGDLDSQIQFLISELRSSSYSTVWNSLTSVSNSADGAYTAAYVFCEQFEKPAGGSSVSEARGNLAKETFWSYYSVNDISEELIKGVESIGAKVVSKARYVKDELKAVYKKNGNIYNTPKQYGVDDAGLVYYSYQEAGFPVPECTAQGYYEEYKSSALHVEISNVVEGDLLFYTSTTNSTSISYVAIATGEGTKIYADNASLSLKEDDIGSPTYILRISSYSYSNNNTTSDSSSEEWSSISSENYATLSIYDIHSQTIAANLSIVQAQYEDENAANDHYGYLIDMTHGGEFVFYIPEFTERAGAQWSGVEIRGRSVIVQSYVSTSSRVISISLDLYAGVGRYAPTVGETGDEVVSRLHSDAYFVKSLEYPDYSNVITRPPATVHLILGSAVNIAGVVSDVSIEHLKPVDSQNRSMYLKLSFTVTQTAENPPDYTDIRRGNNAVVETDYIDTLQTGVVTNTPVYAGGD